MKTVAIDTLLIYMVSCRPEFLNVFYEDPTSDGPTRLGIKGELDRTIEVDVVLLDESPLCNFRARRHCECL